MKKILIAALAALFAVSAAMAEEMKMAVTTSFENSGLAEILLPEIDKDLGIQLQLLVVGTGQAIRLGEAGDVDAILVHSRPAEEKFVASGNATHRTEIMYNDFVLIGPAADPAGIARAASAVDALSRIAAAKAPFASRGDDSGTHQTELKLWEAAGVGAGARDVAWYKETGSGMGATLNTAVGLEAYVLSDRASWLKFANKGDLKLLYAGDPALFNQYAYLPVNPMSHPHVKADLAAKVEAWLVSDRSKALIEGYRIEGEPLFVFNAKAE